MLITLLTDRAKHLEAKEQMFPTVLERESMRFVFHRKGKNWKRFPFPINVQLITPVHFIICFFTRIQIKVKQINYVKPIYLLPYCSTQLWLYLGLMARSKWRLTSEQNFSPPFRRSTFNSLRKRGENSWNATNTRAWNNFLASLQEHSLGSCCCLFHCKVDFFLTFILSCWAFVVFTG
jgi:hypothetical protein